MTSAMRNGAAGRLRHLAMRSVARAFDPMPLRLQARLSGVRLLTPFYHVVTREPPPYLSPPPYALRSPEEFERDLDVILRHFRPLGLEALVEAARTGAPLPRRSFHLTFDDGYREISDVIAPILLRKGIPATFFLCSAFIDNRRFFVENKAGIILNQLQTSGAGRRARLDRVIAAHGLGDLSIGPRLYQMEGAIDRVAVDLDLDWSKVLRDWRPYLGGHEIRRLLSQGFTIGAHSIDHPLYASLTIEEQIRQTLESTDAICGAFDLSYRVFAFPYGEHGISRRYFTEMLGRNAVDVYFGTRGLIRDEFGSRCIQRLWCEDFTGPVENHLMRHLAQKCVRRITGHDLVRRRE